MDDTLQTMAAALQGNLDALPGGDTLQMSRGEYSGPIVINKPLVLDGQGSTIWSDRGPVITIAADKVVLKNLKVHATGSAALRANEERCALSVEPGLALLLEHVEVIGSVAGLREEEGAWRYPPALNLGRLAHGNAHTFILRLAVPIPCRLSSNISGLSIEPHSLAAGKHEVRLHLDRLANDTLLAGTLAITTAFLARHILFMAHVVALPAAASPAASATAPVIWEPSDWATLVVGPQPEPPKPQPVQPAPAPTPSAPVAQKAVPPAPATITKPATAPASSAPSSAPVPPSPPSVPAPSPSRRKTQDTPGGVFAQANPTTDGKETTKTSEHATKTAPVNSLFEKEASDKAKEALPPADQAKKPLTDPQKQAEQAKRKMVKPGSISPLFHVNGEHDEKKGSGSGD